MKVRQLLWKEAYIKNRRYKTLCNYENWWQPVKKILEHLPFILDDVRLVIDMNIFQFELVNWIGFGETQLSN